MSNIESQTMNAKWSWMSNDDQSSLCHFEWW